MQQVSQYTWQEALSGAGDVTVDVAGGFEAPLPEESAEETYPLPSLPEPVLPSTICGQKREDVYEVIKAIRRMLDQTSSHSTVYDMLQSDPDTLKAVATVLHQSGLLKRQVERDGGAELVACPLPPCPPPALPAGITSWIAQ